MFGLIQLYDRQYIFVKLLFTSFVLGPKFGCGIMTQEHANKKCCYLEFRVDVTTRISASFILISK